jgi:hypothetical protein
LERFDVLRWCENFSDLRLDNLRRSLLAVLRGPIARATRHDTISGADGEKKVGHTADKACWLFASWIPVIKSSVYGPNSYLRSTHSQGWREQKRRVADVFGHIMLYYKPCLFECRRSVLVERLALPASTKSCLPVRETQDSGVAPVADSTWSWMCCDGAEKSAQECVRARILSCTRGKR